MRVLLPVIGFVLLAAVVSAQESARPIAISHGKDAYIYQAFPDACRLRDGRIVCVFYAGYTHVSLPSRDYPKGGRICMVESSDEGRNWSEPRVLFDDGDDNRDPHIAQLDDGSMICTFFSWHMAGEPLNSSKDFSWDVFHKRAKITGAQMVRSTDNGKTWDTVAQSVNKKWACSAPVRQLRDGTCLFGLYREEGKDGWGGVTRSTDRGRTWSEPAIIAKDQHLPLDAETDVIQLNDGSVYAALRSSKIDMHYAISHDGGLSFGEAKDIGFKAHCPHLNRLSSGQIIMAHRLPQTAIHVSDDDAKTWRGPYVLDDVIGAYPATVELKDHSVLAVYYTEGGASEIRALRFRVKSDGIEKLPLK